MTELKEECGIAAVYQLKPKGTDTPSVNVSQYIPGMLLDLQHRGQLSAGLSSYNPNRDRLLQTYKDIGNVGQVFKMYRSRKYMSLIEKYAGSIAVGHVRYATSGAEDKNFAQPFERVHGRKWKWFSISYNGNLANYEILKEKLLKKGYHITYNTDTELMMHYINKELVGDERRSYKNIFTLISDTFDGAFNIAFLGARGDLVILRDRNAIKPICYGVKDDLLFVASESVALMRLGIDKVIDLPPGGLLVANDGKYRVEQIENCDKTAHCQFEWVYFANSISTLDGQSVYKARRRLGTYLAQKETVKIDNDSLVVPVPETANIAADAFGFELKIPVMQGLVRNRYVGRTFIEGVNRKTAIMRKFTPVREILEDKKIFLVDDSLVRSSTIRAIVEDLKVRGKVKEVHVRISCPPIIAPCFYGINIPTRKELFTYPYMNERTKNGFSKETFAKMAKDIGVDSLSYLNTDDLCKALGFKSDNLCTACLSAEYPTEWGNKNYAKTLALENIELEN